MACSPSRSWPGAAAEWRAAKKSGRTMPSTGETWLISARHRRSRVSAAAAVTRVDGRTIGAGRPGPLTGQLSGLYRELTAKEGFPILAPVS